jgi:hypothetical protein
MSQYVPTQHSSTSYNITNVLAGSVSPGLDAPRVAGSFPNSSSEARYPIHQAIHTFVALRDTIFVDVL